MKHSGRCVAVLVALAALLMSGWSALASDTLLVDIDIKPCKDPNVLNVNVIGTLPVAILDYVDQVDPASVTLNGVAVSEWVYKSGYLLVKFDAKSVVATLGPVSNGDVVSLLLQGELYTGEPIEGTDEVVILKRGR